jgi:hypothetical protein
VAAAHEYAVGGAAWAEHANDDAATAVISGQPLLAGIHWLAANSSWLTPLIVPAVLLACGAALLLMYRRQPRR